MAGRRRSRIRGVLLPVGVLLAFAAVIALVYSSRSADLAARPGSSSGGTGTLADLPVQALAPVPVGQESAAGGAAGSAGAPTVPSPAVPSSGPGAADGSSPTPAGSPAGSGAGAAVGSEAVLWLDGWSALLAGSGRFQVRDVVSGREASVVFSPLSAEQIRSATAAHPQVIASYLARLATSSSDVACSSDGTCTVDGEPVDPGILADAGKLPGVGAVYAGAGIRYGLLAARLSGSGGALVVTSPSGTTAYLDGLPPGDGSERPAPAAANGFGVGSWPLAFGLGRVFVNDPAWIGADPVQYRASGRVGLTGAQDDGTLQAAPVLVTSVADRSAAAWAALLSDSEMTYLTSPASGCGSIAFCSPVPVAAELSEFRSTAAVACLKDAPAGDGAKALLLGQVVKVSASFTKPVIMLGLGVRQDSVLELDVTRQDPVTGPVLFTQQGVFVVTDDGIVTTAGRRNLPALSLSSPELFGGQFGPCSS